MPNRHLPVHPDLHQLKIHAKDLLKAIRRRDADALAELEALHPKKVDPAAAKLADVQLILARSYHASSWLRLVLACNIIDAIWNDDVDGLRAILTSHPELVHEDARVQKGCNWGPPMSYAANLGRDRIIAMLRERSARGTSASRSHSPLANVHARRDLPTGAWLSR